MKYLITGNRGFIGSHLQQQLKKEGHKVVGLDNNFHSCKNKVDGIIGDIRNEKLIDELVKEVDVVMHAAAIIHVDYSIKYPKETIDVNIGGTLNILEAVKKYNKRMVFASTSEVYGSSMLDIEGMDEYHQLDCQSPYGASKVAGDRLCKSYYETYGTKITILRNFNTFGKFQNDTSYGGVIAIFTRAALTGKPMRIFGSGEQQRDYMCIEDAIAGYKLCSEEKKLIGQVVNVGTGSTITINNLARLIKDISGSKSKIIHVAPRAGEVQRLCADIQKAKSFGFQPITDFEKDLSSYINWYKKEMLK